MNALRYTKWATAALCLALSAVYIAMSFGEAPYEPFVEFIFSSAPGLILHIGLIISLTAWSVLATIKRIRKEVVSPDSINSMDECVHLPSGSGIGTMDEASEWMRRMGFSPRASGEGIEAGGGRLGIIPGIVLRAGLALLMLSALMSHHMRETDHALLAQGGRMSVAMPATLLGREVYPVRIDAGLSDEFLNLGSAGFELEEVSAIFRTGQDEFRVTGGYPTRAAGLYWRVRHLGYAQTVQHEGVLETLMLDVLPPGTASAHSLAPGGQVHEFRLAPEKAVKKGLITGDVFDLKAPRYELSPRGKKGAKVKVRAGESALMDGREAAFGLPGHYVRLQAVRDPALPLLRLGFYITSLGVLMMLLRLFWYERRIAAVMHEGRVLIGYSEEFYKKWGIYKFRKWTGPLL
jgi:hypothetical protein